MVSAACNYFEFDWFAGLSPSFLIGQITLVLVLRHSIETRSISIICFIGPEKPHKGVDGQLSRHAYIHAQVVPCISYVIDLQIWLRILG